MILAICKYPLVDTGSDLLRWAESHGTVGEIVSGGIRSGCDVRKSERLPRRKQNRAAQGDEAGC
jgi:hypothetical protein